MKDSPITSALLFVSMALLAPSAAEACAVCLAGTGAADPLAEAINWSVLFLMAMPYAVMGSIAGWLYYNYRRRRSVENKPAALRLAWENKESGK